MACTLYPIGTPIATRRAPFGAAVGTAGDVNGDGYPTSSWARQVERREDNEGGAWVYLGSDKGLSDSYGWHQESNSASARYGSLSWHRRRHQRRRLVRYHRRGPAGLMVRQPKEKHLSIKATAQPGNGSCMDQREQPGGAQFGNSVSTAGDVNGDG